jgi:hypothetical protein
MENDEWKISYVFKDGVAFNNVTIAACPTI